MKSILLIAALSLGLTVPINAQQAQITGDKLPAIGEWDGVTPSAVLDGPYEDPKQANVPFGIISYYNQPWRSYMDTWPARKFTEVPGVNWNIDLKYAEPIAQLMQESGIRYARVEVGWGSIGWDDDLRPDVKQRTKNLLTVLQKHGIRPLILLNAHHGLPCPVRDVPVEITADARKGDRTLKLKSAQGVRPHYTGIQHPDYIAAYPVITKVDEDGTAHLSAGLPVDIKTGPLTLKELKYQPFQGVKLKDGTPVPAAQETADGWMKYAAAVGRFVREALGTQGQPDAGFDIEVWNEQTFGSNFLDINRYYDEKIEYAEPFVYRKTRPLLATYRPNAQTQFEQKDAYAILPMTIDYFNDPANGFRGVNVISGFANQWPWDSGTALWDGQAGFSRHYYTGGWQDVSPETPPGHKDSGTIDALGNFDGKRAGNEWHQIVPGTNFAPTFRMGFPEFFHSGFKTESLSRDVIPDSRLSGMGGPHNRHGRYTHNGDFHTAQVWQTEVNYDRSQFFDAVVKETGVKRDDPRLLALAQHMAGKMLLRQYLFHAHKGLQRIMLFSLQPDPYSLGVMPPSVYAALDKSNDVLTPEVRAVVPPEFKGMSWLARVMADGENLAAPRPLQVEKLVEYKPRLVFAGDGTPAHPHRWNRDQFAFLPFQLTASKFMIPYYVVTLDVTHRWDKQKDVLDPKRYDMPDQEFDVTVSNVAGPGTTVTAYDPLTNTPLPVRVVSTTANSLTVRLRAVDYPRILQVTEAKVGPQIIEPQVALNKDQLTVSWKTNIPARAVQVTYGPDWPHRSSHEIDVPADKTTSGKTTYSVKVPANAGVNAVRIRVAANGLSDVWPRWDEDPVGQVVVPGRSTLTDSTTTKP
ncbi:MAG: hypothetical protein JO316_15805 [Abitibacteriaceae bacterium]|nr:hypothetical protein [Abditibacteriaceae bacterium]MBV9866820.1 hypothetical protein [Abditibacteriaceae bacterium]